MRADDRQHELNCYVFKEDIHLAHHGNYILLLEYVDVNKLTNFRLKTQIFNLIHTVIYNVMIYIYIDELILTSIKNICENTIKNFSWNWKVEKVRNIWIHINNTSILRNFKTLFYRNEWQDIKISIFISFQTLLEWILF